MRRLHRAVHAEAGATCRSRRTAAPAMRSPATDVMLRPSPALRSRMRGQHELGEVQRREHVHLEHETRSLLGELVERPQERDRGVVHEDVGRADLLDDFGHHAARGPRHSRGRLGPRRPCRPRRRSRRGSRVKEPTYFVVGVHRPRGDRDGGALGGEAPRDRLCPVPRLAPVTSATFPSHAPGMNRDTSTCPRSSSISMTSARGSRRSGSTTSRALAGGASSLTYSALGDGTSRSW